MASEKYLEKKLREDTHDMGCLALKFTSAYYTGFPDRLILIPGGRVKWAEFKSTGKEPSDAQKSRIKLLRKLGFDVSIVDDLESLEKLKKEIEHEIRTGQKQ